MPNLGDYFRHLPTLETERLVLRPVRKTDWQDMWEYAHDPKVSALTTGEYHHDLDATHAYIDRVLDHYAAGQVENWGLELKATHAFVGMAGFSDASAEHRVGEIGYVLSSRHWNQGLTTEAIRAVLDQGFSALGLEKIFARFLSENIASRRILEKLGFRKEAHLRSQFVKDGLARDVEIYGMLKDEMPGRGTLLMELLAMLGADELEVFHEVLQGLIDRGGRIESVSAAALAKSGKPGLANNLLIRKLSKRGVLQPVKGRRGCYALTPAWSDLAKTAAE